MQKRLLFVFFSLPLLLPVPVYTQTIGENLEKLTALIDSSLSSIENTERDNENLKTTLENLSVSLGTQSLLLKEQGTLLNEQEEGYTRLRQIYETQKAYLATLQFKYKVYKVSLIVAVPTCIGLGIWLGWKLAGN
jgi:hypothetical protein